MKALRWLAAALLFTSAGAAFAADTPESWDGLVEVKPKRMDAAFLLPGADFRPYTKVMIDPTQVAFQKDWFKRMNDTRDLSRRVSKEEAEQILAAARANFDEIFAAEYTKAGYAVVTTPGPDVLRVSTAVVNLYINAPDVGSTGMSKTFTTEAGEATLFVEVRDSQSGALMGRVIDRRETQGIAGRTQANRATNTTEFRLLFQNWAGITIQGLEELKAHSPVPMDLKPKQKM
jgi:hypothetical protein